LGNKNTIPILMKILENETSDRMKELLRSTIEELQERD